MYSCLDIVKPRTLHGTLISCTLLFFFLVIQYLLCVFYFFLTWIIYYDYHFLLWKDLSCNLSRETRRECTYISILTCYMVLTLLRCSVNIRRQVHCSLCLIQTCICGVDVGNFHSANKKKAVSFPTWHGEKSCQEAERAYVCTKWILFLRAWCTDMMQHGAVKMLHPFSKLKEKINLTDWLTELVRKSDRERGMSDECKLRVLNERNYRGEVSNFLVKLLRGKKKQSTSFYGGSPATVKNKTSG